MRVRVKKIRDVLKVNKNFATIEEIDDRGRVVYQLEYYADIANAIIRNSMSVRVSIYNKNPLAKSSLFANVKTGKDAVKNVRTRLAKQKQKIRNSRGKPLVRRMSDISIGINNSVAMKIAKRPQSANELLGKKRIMKSVKSSRASRDQLRSRPALGISKIKKAKSLNTSTRMSAIKSILRDGIDPSTIGEMPFPLISSRDAIDGTIRESKRSKAVSRARRVKRKKSSRYRAKLARARKLSKNRDVGRAKKNRRTKALKQHFQQDRRRTVGGKQKVASKTRTIIQYVPARWESFEVELPIPKKKLANVNRLYALFELLGKGGEVVDQELRIINHDALLNRYFTPKVPALISVTSAKIGINVLSLKQLDPVATKILIYRKFLNPNDPQIGRKYKPIGEVEATIDDASITYKDLVNNSIACVYRAVAVGPRRRRSNRFRNAVAKAVPLPVKSGISNDDLSHVSIFAETIDEAVQVRVTNIPEGPCALYVVASDKTAHCATRPLHGHCRVVGIDIDEQIQPVSSHTPELIFNDRAVLPNHIYEYHAKMIYPSGKEVTSKVSEVYHFIQDYESDNITISSGSPTVSVDDNGSATVQFDVSADFSSAGFDEVVQALTTAGVESDFTAELGENRELLQNLLAFEMLRQDDISGETESFGVVQNLSTFIDNNETRVKAGVTSLLPGRSYRYIMNVCERDPGTLFVQTSETSIDISTDSEYQLKVFKFLNPLTLKRGTLPSTARAAGTSDTSGLVARNPFLQGKSSLTHVVDVTVPSQRTQITNLAVSRASDSESLLTWTVAGAADEIDHFLILAELEGVKSTLGTVHNESESSQFQYLDDDLAIEVGTVEYSVISVFADYTYGAETASVSIINAEELPGFAIST